MKTYIAAKYISGAVISTTEICVLLTLSEGDPALNALIRFRACTAARSTEIAALRWGDLSLDGRVCRLPLTYGACRIVPLSDGVASILETMKLEASNDGDDDPVWGHTPKFWNSVRPRWSALFTKWFNLWQAGIVDVPPPAHPYPMRCLRQFAIDSVLDFGVPAEEVAQWAGLTCIIMAKTPQATSFH